MSINSYALGLSSYNACGVVVNTTSVKANYSAVLTRVTTRMLSYRPSSVAIFKTSASTSPCSSNSCTSSAACVAKVTARGTTLRLHRGVGGVNTRLLNYTTSRISFSNGRICVVGPSNTSGKTISMDLSSVTAGTRIGGAVPMSIATACSSPISPPPCVMKVIRVRLSGRAKTIGVLSCRTIISYKVPIGPGLTHIRARNNVNRKVNVTLCRGIACGTSNGVTRGSFVRCGVPAQRSIKRVGIRFRADCRPSNPFKIGSVNRVIVGAPTPTLTRTVCHTANM